MSDKVRIKGKWCGYAEQYPYGGAVATIEVEGLREKLVNYFKTCGHFICELNSNTLANGVLQAIGAEEESIDTDCNNYENKGNFSIANIIEELQPKNAVGSGLFADEKINLMWAKINEIVKDINETRKEKNIKFIGNRKFRVGGKKGKVI